MTRGSSHRSKARNTGASLRRAEEPAACRPIYGSQVLGFSQPCADWWRDRLLILCKGPNFLWVDKGSTKLQASWAKVAKTKGQS